MGHGKRGPFVLRPRLGSRPSLQRPVVPDDRKRVSGSCRWCPRGLVGPQLGIGVVEVYGPKRSSEVSRRVVRTGIPSFLSPECGIPVIYSLKQILTPLKVCVLDGTFWSFRGLPGHVRPVNSGIRVEISRSFTYYQISFIKPLSLCVPVRLSKIYSTVKKFCYRPLRLFFQRLVGEWG